MLVTTPLASIYSRPHTDIWERIMCGAYSRETAQDRLQHVLLVRLSDGARKASFYSEGLGATRL